MDVNLTKLQHATKLVKLPTEGGITAYLMPKSTVMQTTLEDTRCPHLKIPIVGDTVKIKTVCDSGERVSDFQVCGCALYDRCVPSYHCVKTAISEEVLEGAYAKPCKTCEDNPLNQTDNLTGKET